MKKKILREKKRITAKENASSLPCDLAEKQTQKLLAEAMTEKIWTYMVDVHSLLDTKKEAFNTKTGIFFHIMDVFENKVEI